MYNEPLTKAQRAKMAQQHHAEQQEQTRRADLGTYTPARRPGASRPSGKKGQKIKKPHRIHPAVKVLIAVLLMVGLTGMGVFNFILAKYKPAENFSRAELALSREAPSMVKHIAIFGVDSYDSLSGRADSTMVLTIDRRHGQIKLTSIQRDSYLPVKDHGKDKLTHAYAYGGAELMLRTINENFRMNITEYVVLDYKNVADIVDLLGGIELEISEGERKEINRISKEMDPDVTKVKEAGMVHLNGLQATAYARIRKIDTETQRTQRQRTVISKLLKKLKDKKVSEYPALLQQLAAIPSCSLSKTEIAGMAISLLGCDSEIRQYVIPSEEDDAIGGSYGGFWCWRYDIDAAADRWHEFLKSDIPSGEETTDPA